MQDGIERGAMRCDDVLRRRSGWVVRGIRSRILEDHDVGERVTEDVDLKDLLDIEGSEMSEDEDEEISRPLETIPVDLLFSLPVDASPPSRTNLLHLPSTFIVYYRSSARSLPIPQYSTTA
jgi:hypothetical protein